MTWGCIRSSFMRNGCARMMWPSRIVSRLQYALTELWVVDDDIEVKLFCKLHFCYTRLFLLVQRLNAELVVIVDFVKFVEVELSCNKIIPHDRGKFNTCTSPALMQIVMNAPTNVYSLVGLGAREFGYRDDESAVRWDKAHCTFRV